MKSQLSILAISLSLALSSCYASKEIDYGKVFEGETAEDVISFVQESGLMESPDWEIYAIGIDEYLRRCTEEDVYFATKACNLDQIRGAKARTLYWQFLTMAERELNEAAIRQILALESSFEKAREMDLLSEKNRKK